MPMYFVDWLCKREFNNPDAPMNNPNVSDDGVLVWVLMMGIQAGYLDAKGIDILGDDIKEYEA